MDDRQNRPSLKDRDADQIRNEQRGGAAAAKGAPGKASGELPPAGPHDDPALTNPDSTPGTGALPPAGAHGDVDSTSS